MSKRLSSKGRHTYGVLLFFTMMSVTSIAPFFLKLEHNDQFENLLRGSIVSKSKWASQVDIMSVPPIEPIFIGQLNSSDVPYLVSFPWWDGRINKTNFLRKTGACGVKCECRYRHHFQFLFSFPSINNLLLTILLSSFWMVPLTAIWTNPTVIDVQKIIADTKPNDIFVDVGANVG